MSSHSKTSGDGEQPSQLFKCALKEVSTTQSDRCQSFGLKGLSTQTPKPEIEIASTIITTEVCGLRATPPLTPSARIAEPRAEWQG